jgi:DNA polymerase-3 subunit delta
MDALTFLERAPRTKRQPVYVLHGDEDFLKRQALAALRTLCLGSEGDEFGFSVHAGETATWSDLRSELETAPFLGSCRVVVVDAADPFVTRHRAALEKYVTEPAATGVLVLVVKSWPATTRLAKLIDPAASIVCKGPAAYRLPEWCVRWTAAHYDKELNVAAARLLVDLVGAEMGQLDQELAKLATYVGTAKRISLADVDQLVGHSREENTFKIFDAIADGQVGEAFKILDRLFDHGEDAMRILGAFSMQLRRLAQAARLTQQGNSLGAALDRVGVPFFARQSAENQLRHLGKRKTDGLYAWLLETDLGLKGGSQLPARVLIERIVARLAQ